MPDKPSPNVSKKFKEVLHAHNKRSNKQLAQITAVMEKFVERVGGLDKFVELLHNEWQGAGTGGLIRQRIMASILDGFKFAERQNPPQDDLSLVTDEDIDAELASLMLKVQDELARIGDVGEAVGESPATPTEAGSERTDAGEVSAAPGREGEA